MNMLIRICAVALALALCAGVTYGQTFPSRPIRIIVPYSPGAATDSAARAVGESMQTQFGQPVVIENVTGATGNIGLERAAKSPADGYTLILASAINTSNSAARPGSSLDLLPTFRPVGRIGDNAFALIVSPTLGVNSVADLVAMAKAKPGMLSAASAGIGSSHHLVLEMFKAAAGIDVIHVPFRGEAAALSELTSGRVQMAFFVSARSWIEQGQVKGLATTAAGTWPPLPGLPSLASQGYPSMTISGWNGLMVPAGTPDDVVAKLNAALNTALKTDRVRQVLAGIGFEPAGGTPEAMGNQIKSDVRRFKEIIEQRKLQFGE